MNSQDDAHTDRQDLSGAMRPDELAEPLFLCLGQFNRIAWLGTSHGLFLPGQIYLTFLPLSISEQIYASLYLVTPVESANRG